MPLSTSMSKGPRRVVVPTLAQFQTFTCRYPPGAPCRCEAYPSCRPCPPSAIIARADRFPPLQRWPCRSRRRSPSFSRACRLSSVGSLNQPLVQRRRRRRPKLILSGDAAEMGPDTRYRHLRAVPQTGLSGSPACCKAYPGSSHWSTFYPVAR